MKRAWLFICMLCVLVACSHTQSSSEKPIIAVSLLPEKFFMERIVGDLATVHVVVPKGSNPEIFDPSPRDIATLQSALAYFSIGTLPFEQQWTSALPDSVRVVNIAKLLPEGLIFGHDGAYTHDHILGDPHYWSSLKGGKAMAEAMLQACIEIFPEQEKLLKQNYAEQLSPLFAQLEALGKEVFGTQQDVAFVIYHPSLSLFADEWGLTQLVIEENGLEPSPRQLVRVIDEARTKNTKAVLMQEEFDRNSCASIAGQLGIPTVSIQPLSEDWYAEMCRLIEIFR